MSRGISDFFALFCALFRFSQIAGKTGRCLQKQFAASTFVKTLYEELRKGRTMSQAARVGREAARQAGEGTWLAYAVYAHPHLRVTFSD